MENYFYITPEHYKTAEENGIPAHAVYRRVNEENWSIQRAITQPLAKRTKSQWSQWKEIATRNGVGYQTFVQRVNTQKWTPEKAATTTPLSRKELMKDINNKRKNRVLTNEQIKRAEANGVSYQLLYYRRVIRKWDIEDAITRPVIPQNEVLENARSKRKANSYLRRSITGFWDGRKQRALTSK